MVILIDNGDSFSYSLADYLGVLGAKVQLFRFDQLSLKGIVDLRPKGIILSSGSKASSANRITNQVIEAFAGHIPLLGVSSGHQLIAQVFGGKLCPAPQPIHGKAVPIYHDGESIYEGIPSPFLGARYHSLVVDRNHVPDCFELCAWTEDGLIMGLRHKEWAIEGVQFQPESILTKQGLALIRNFLHAYSLVEN